MTGQTLIGRTGRVTTAVRGGSLPGEVRVVVEGLPHYYLAYCDHAVDKDTYVLVIDAHGARGVDVEPWQPPGPQQF